MDRTANSRKILARTLKSLKEQGFITRRGRLVFKKSRKRKKWVDPITYLFDIPIYWCKEEISNAKYKEKLNGCEERMKKDLREKGMKYEPTEEDRKISHNILWPKLMGPWRFNQIVGWVRVYRLGDQLRGEYWSIKAKRFGLQVKKKRLTPQGKAFEIWPGDKETSEQIFHRMCQKLRAFEKELQGRVLDLESFEKLGRFVDWRQLTDTLNA